MAHGLNAMLKRGTNTLGCKANDGKAGLGSRRIFAPLFKLQVLDSYRNDADCKGNQRATARKYGIHRRQIQKWLQVENNLRNSVIKSKSSELIVSPEARKGGIELALRSAEAEHRQRDDVCSETYTRQHHECCQLERDTHADLERTSTRIGGTLPDKRVPDIPHNHTPSTTNTPPPPLPPATVHYNVSVPVPVSVSEQPHQWHNGYGSDSEQCPCEPSSPPSLAASPSYECPLPPLPPLPPLQPPLTPPLTLPLDFSRRSQRGASPSPVEVTTSAAPIDLSLKRPYTYTIDIPYPRIRIKPDLCTPASTSMPPLTSPPTSLPPLPPHIISPTHCDDTQSHVWDLSTRGGVKRRYDDSSRSLNSISAPTKPVKLFKPYLDHVDDMSTTDMPTNVSTDVKPSVITSAAADSASTNSSVYSDSEPYFYNNNNNTDFKMDYAFYKEDRNVYCPIISEALTCDYYPHGPVHFGSHYDETRNQFIITSKNVSNKQRQSYSLDFKLSAIECYYSDAECRGNQRAVASKFKIHRRQVQKWLKQEDELRQRNETTKPMHIVR